MNRVIVLMGLISALTGIMVEVALYVCLIIGEISFYQFIVGYCLIRMAEYCFIMSRKCYTEAGKDGNSD